MEEFRRVHRKMFAAISSDDNDNNNDDNEDNCAGGSGGGGGGGGGGVRVKETERQTDKEGRKVMEIVRREEAKKEAKPKVSKDTEEDVALVRNETKVASASLRKFIQTCYQESICMNFLGLCDQWSIL